MKKLFLLAPVSCLLITSSSLVAISCSNKSTDSNTEQIVGKDTIVNDKINNIDLNLATVDINAARNMIDNDFVYKNIKLFFKGDLNPDLSQNDIKVSQVAISEKLDRITFLVEIAANKTYKNGILNPSIATFNVQINWISSPNNNDSTDTNNQGTRLKSEHIHASNLGLNALDVVSAFNEVSNSLIFTKKEVLFNGSFASDLVANDITVKKEISKSLSSVFVTIVFGKNKTYKADGTLNTEQATFNLEILGNYQLMNIAPKKSVIPLSDFNVNESNIEFLYNAINNQFIMEHLRLFFSGSFQNDLSANDITVVKTKKQNELAIKLTITFAKDKYYFNNKWADVPGTFTLFIDGRKPIVASKYEKDNILCSSIGLSASDGAAASVSKITPKLIYDNLDKMFNCNFVLDINEGDISILKTPPISSSNREIRFLVAFAPNKVYNIENGKLIGEQKIIQIVIKGFNH